MAYSPKTAIAKAMEAKYGKGSEQSRMANYLLTHPGGIRRTNTFQQADAITQTMVQTRGRPIPKVYDVVGGDNLAKIAGRFYGGDQRMLAAIIAANPDHFYVNSSGAINVMLHPGDKLNMPSSYNPNIRISPELWKAVGGGGDAAPPMTPGGGGAAYVTPGQPSDPRTFDLQPGAAPEARRKGLDATAGAGVVAGTSAWGQQGTDALGIPLGDTVSAATSGGATWDRAKEKSEVEAILAANAAVVVEVDNVIAQLESGVQPNTLSERARMELSFQNVQNGQPPITPTDLRGEGYTLVGDKWTYTGTLGTGDMESEDLFGDAADILGDTSGLFDEKAYQVIQNNLRRIAQQTGFKMPAPRRQASPSLPGKVYRSYSGRGYGEIGSSLRQWRMSVNWG